MNDKAPNLQPGRKLAVPSNGATLLRRDWRTLIIGFINSVLGLRVVQPYSDGTNTLLSQDADVKMSSNGMVITMPPVGLPGSSGGGGTLSVQQFKIVSDGGDYWICKTWDGTTLGSTLVNVAKPYKLRSVNGPSQEQIRNINYNYTYNPITVAGVIAYYIRNVSGGDGSSETNYMIPDPLANDIIYGISFSTNAPATLQNVNFIDLNVDGRAWAK